MHFSIPGNPICLGTKGLLNQRRRSLRARYTDWYCLHRHWQCSRHEQSCQKLQRKGRHSSVQGKLYSKVCCGVKWRHLWKERRRLVTTSNHSTMYHGIFLLCAVNVGIIIGGAVGGGFFLFFILAVAACIFCSACLFARRKPSDSSTPREANVTTGLPRYYNNNDFELKESKNVYEKVQ